MITVGIDIGKEKHAAAILDANGRRLVKTNFYPNTREGADRLLKAMEQFAPPCETHAGMESTGSYWAAFHSYLVKAGCRVDVINPLVTSASMAGDIRGRKTDRQDAEKIAALMLTGDYTPNFTGGPDERRVKAVTRQHGYEKGHMAATKTHFKSLLDVAFPEFGDIVDDVYSVFSMNLLEKYPTAAHLSAARKASVAALVAKYTRGKDAEEEAKRLITAAKASLAAGLDEHEEYAVAVRDTLQAIRDCEARIAKLESAIKEKPATGIARTLMQIKGAGVILPRVIAAEYGDLSRFEKSPKTGSSRGMAKRLLAFAGAEPRVKESGKWKGEIRVSKRGSGYLRYALYMLAFSISRFDPYFRGIYEYHKNTLHKHHCKALLCVVAKLLDVICALHKSGRDYTVEKPGANVINSPEANCEK